MSSTPITARFANDRVYFVIPDNKDAKLPIDKGIAYHWKITGFVLWILRLASKIHYNDNGKTNFVFVNKASCQAWIDKYRKEFALEKVDNQEESIKIICQRVVTSSVKKPKEQTVSEVRIDVAPIPIANQSEVFISYDDLMKKAEEVYATDDRRKEIIDEIKHYLRMCNYEINASLNRQSSVMEPYWVELNPVVEMIGSIRSIKSSIACEALYFLRNNTKIIIEHNPLK